MLTTGASLISLFFLFFFFNDTATTEIYTLSLHDALPISWPPYSARPPKAKRVMRMTRSEEHTSELQSRQYLVCRLLLEKKKKKPITHTLKKKQKLNQQKSNKNNTN